MFWSLEAPPLPKSHCRLTIAELPGMEMSFKLMFKGGQPLILSAAYWAVGDLKTVIKLVFVVESAPDALVATNFTV